MANKILKTYLSPDIVDYCIVPYLSPAEGEVKKMHCKLLKELYIIVDWADFQSLYSFDTPLDEPIVTTILRKKYYKSNDYLKESKTWLPSMEIT